MCVSDARQRLQKRLRIRADGWEFRVCVCLVRQKSFLFAGCQDHRLTHAAHNCSNSRSSQTLLMTGDLLSGISGKPVLSLTQWTPVMSVAGACVRLLISLYFYAPSSSSSLEIGCCCVIDRQSSVKQPAKECLFTLTACMRMPVCESVCVGDECPCFDRRYPSS